MNTDFEAAFHNEPVNFLLSNALRHLTQDQQRQLCNALQERLPVPASIEQEAERLYPDSKENFDIKIAINDLHGRERSAHITCARQYMGEVEAKETRIAELEKENAGLKTYYTAYCEVMADKNNGL